PFHFNLDCNIRTVDFIFDDILNKPVDVEEASGIAKELSDMSDVANGYLETILYWIPGMENIRLRDFPSFIQTRDIDDTMLNYMLSKAAAIPKGSTIVLNTFDALEHDSVNALTITNPQTFTIGPPDMLQQHFCYERLKQLGSDLGRKSKLH
nr:UDP-glycosyltransferase 85A8-like [Tanacetum cinerariifolium]